MHILIVGTQPFNNAVQSRSYASYFGTFKPSEVIQIFSDARVPCKGFCAKLFQITDERLVRRRFEKNEDVIYDRENLKEVWSGKESVPSRWTPKRKTGFYRFLRKFVWNKKYWLTKRLENFVEDFRPDAVFLSWGEDFFLMDVAEYFAKKYEIPIFVSITDDCYFFTDLKREGFDLLRALYLRKYRQRVDAFFKGDVYGFFVSDKIMEKYENYFQIPGVVAPIGSSIEPIWKEPETDLRNGIYYFGNLEYGRLKAIEAFSVELNKFFPLVPIHVFSKDVKSDRNKGNLFLHASVSYKKAVEIMKGACSALLLAESFESNDIAHVRYSLSTKVGDCFCAMKPIICIGGRGAGAVDFVKEQKCAFICDNLDDMPSFCRGLLPEIQKKAADYLIKQYEIARNVFNETNSSLKWRDNAEAFLNASRLKKTPSLAKYTISENKEEE